MCLKHNIYIYIYIYVYPRYLLSLNLRITLTVFSGIGWRQQGYISSAIEGRYGLVPGITMYVSYIL